MTRCVLVVAFGFFLSLSMGVSQEVPELDRLEELYAEQIAKVTDPVREGYRKALVRLQDSYTKEANLDAALAVRKEIERIDAELASGEAATPPGVAETATEKDVVPDSSLRSWRGDGQSSNDEGEPTLRVKAASSARAIENSFDVDDFDDGMVLKFQYRATGYSGSGIHVKGYNTPTGHFRYSIPVDSDGRWREVEWPYESSKYEDARVIRFVIEVQAGGGDIEFKDLVVEEL